MEKIFLAFSFRQEDRDLVRVVEQVLASHDVRQDNGEDLGGESLTPAIKARIDKSDALVGLLTPRDQKPNGRFDTHPWVRDEINYARAKEKPAIAIVDTSVDLEGAYQEHERIDYNPASPMLTVLKLMRTIGEWKRSAGRRAKVRILPDELGDQVSDGREGAKCSYRLIRNGNPSAWQEAGTVREVGGTFTYLRGLQDDSLIQLRVQISGVTWLSAAAPHWMHVELKKEKRR